ncbi:restriction endonuclease subunit S [Enterococcus avium]|uniref:restriction endonuclease subunit S n=1 Tax=Enterococcus avium TaxID=33945 RepID=UPI003D6AB7B3
MKYKLSELAFYSTEKIEIDKVDESNYISTENILPNKSGICIADKLPQIKKVNAYKNGDILISNIRPYFKKIWFANRDGGHSADVLNFRAKEGVSNRFLYALLFQDIFFNQMMLSSKGTKMPRGDKNAIMNLEFEVPSYNKQEKIGDILFCFQDKIELNNQIISNLEELASTLFKRWFVDFEFPDENGTPYKSSGGKMVDSELGEIPESFSVENFGSHIKYMSKGTTPTKKDLLSSKSIKNVKYLKVKDIPSVGMINYKNLEEIPEDVHEKQLKRSALKKGDIILSIAGTIGRVNIISSETELNTNQAVSFIRLNEERFQYYYLQLLKSKYYQQILHKKIVQAVQANLSLSEIKKMKIVVPPKEVISSFTIVIDNLYSNIISTDREKNNLEELRDLLLPKLLSGEIELPEDEEV